MRKKHQLSSREHFIISAHTKLFIYEEAKYAYFTRDKMQICSFLRMKYNFLKSLGVSAPAQRKICTV